MHCQKISQEMLVATSRRIFRGRTSGDCSRRTRETVSDSRKYWWAGRDSNPEPSDYEPRALPLSYPPQRSCLYTVLRAQRLV